MTAKDIKQGNVEVPPGYQADLAFWLKEIAYQLAVMNEREEDNNYFQEYGVRLRPEK
jgi:hypothetical protein